MKAKKIKFIQNATFAFGELIGGKHMCEHYEDAMYDALKYLDNNYDLLNNEETKEDWEFISNFMDGYVICAVRNFAYLEYHKIAYENNKEGFNNVINDFKSRKLINEYKKRTPKDEVKELV